MSPPTPPTPDDSNAPPEAAAPSREPGGEPSPHHPVLASEAGFRRIFEDAPIGIALARPDMTFLRSNTAFQRLVGLDEAGLRGRTFLDLTHPEDVEQDRLLARRLLRGETAKYQLEKRFIRPDGTVVWANLTASAIRDPEENVVYALKMVEDVTERKSLEEQLHQSQKMEAVGRLAGGIAHDFNNLLSVIGGYTQLVYLRTPADNPVREQLGEVLRAAERAADLTRQLLAFGRRQVVQPRVLDVNETLGDMQNLLRRLIGEDVELEFRRAEELGRIRMDPGQIEQIVMNLAVNARDAMPGGGRLVLETANVNLGNRFPGQGVQLHPGAYVMLAVTDSGSGIPAGILARIFEPFFTTKERGKGTGLGLATVYGIVKQNEGYVFCESVVDEGTTFRVYLPRVDAEPDDRPTDDIAAASQVGTETILLVEDEAMVRELVEEILIGAGYKVLTAGLPDHALEIARVYPDPIDLLLTDVIMPGKSGRDVAAAVSGTRPRMKVLFMSGYTDDALVGPNVLGPDTLLLQKPFRPEDLRRKVREALSGR